MASLLTVVGIVVLLCGAGVVLTVLPFVKAVDLAERRGFSPDRWGVLTLLGIGLAVLLGYRALQHTWLLAVPVLALPWVPAGLLSLLSPSQRTLGGAAGAHE